MPKPQVEAETKVQAVKPTNALIAVVAIAEQRISVYGGDGLIARGPVSTGMAGFRTPTGVFSVIQKNRWHRSNIYSGAPMPFMQRITWSGIALHLGVLPGYPASHGCIRLPSGLAQQLWGMTKLGARVVVAPHDTAAFEIEHPRLPVPVLTPAPAQVADNGVAQAGNTLIEAAREGTLPAVTVALNDGAASAALTRIAAPKLLNPAERAQAAQVQTRADAAAAVKAAKAALELSVEKSADANRAAAALKSALSSVAAAEARLAAIKKAAEAARSAEATEKAAADRAAAEVRLADAIKAAEEARSAEAVNSDAAFAAAVASREADAAIEAAEAAAKAATRALEPISVFVSRKEGRLFVRQGWTPLFDVAVTFRNPELPLGTHLFVAMEPAAEGGPLRWTAVSMPAASAEPASDRSARKGGRAEPDSRPAPLNAPRETAAGALSRVEIPAETLQRISERVWTGASLIISDYGISGETGTYTDFIVLTR